MGIGRLFKEKATGADGKFKFCAGDSVIAKIGDNEETIMAPVKVRQMLDNLDGCFTVAVEGTDESGQSVLSWIFSGDIHNPKTSAATSDILPSYMAYVPDGYPSSVQELN